MTTTVEEFIKDKLPIEAVTLDETLETAVRRMTEHDFSQLPVVNRDFHPIGVITSDSVLQALYNFRSTLDGILIKHAYQKKVQIFEQSIDLLDLFEGMRDNFVLIVNDEGMLVQIITDFDTAEYFRQRAKDIILVEDIENMLKEFVQFAFDSEPNGEQVLSQAIESMTNATASLKKKFDSSLKSYINRSSSSSRISLNQDLANIVFENQFDDKRPSPTFEDLTMGQYISLFFHRAYWPKFQHIFGLKKESMEALLESIRHTRNDLAHFREISNDQSHQLRRCYDLLIDHQDDVIAAFDSSDSLMEEVQEPAPQYGTSTPLSESEQYPTDDEPEPGESRYAPLAIWLENQPPEKNLVKPSFSKIEEIIGGKLPASAYKLRSWWANDSVGHVQSRQWLDVGWRVASADLNKQVVRFARIKDRQRAYIDFYSELIGKLRQEPQFAHLGPPRPDGVNWYWTKGVTVNGAQAGSFNYSFGRRGIFRIEFYISFGDKELNKNLFDWLAIRKEEIEKEMGHELLWQRLDSRKASRISRINNYRITQSAEKLAELQEKALPAMIKFSEIMLSYVEQFEAEKSAE